MILEVAMAPATEALAIRLWPQAWPMPGSASARGISIGQNTAHMERK